MIAHTFLLSVSIYIISIIARMQRLFTRIAQRSIQATSVRAVAQPVRVNATKFAIRSFSQATEKAEVIPYVLRIFCSLVVWC